MIWFLFAIGSAFFQSVSDVFNKTSSVLADEYLVAWFAKFFAFLFLIPVLLFTSIPAITGLFWVPFVITAVLNVVAIVLYVKALKASDLSLAAPMLSFTPVFLLLTGPVLIGEFPSFVGLLGVLSVFVGAYFLNLRKRTVGFWEPLRALANERGVRLMLVVAFLYSITSVYAKVAVMNSSPLFWVVSDSLLCAVILFPFFWLNSKNKLSKIQSGWKSLVLMSVSSALAVLSQMIVISLTLVAYIISIKRLSTVFGVFWGKLLFKEKDFKERLVGAIIMAAGIILIALS